MLWALREIYRDWTTRQIEKRRTNIPANFTGATLRYIRQKACLQAGIKSCACWSKGERTALPGENPCQQCAEPGVSIEQFSSIIFSQDDPLTEASLNRDDRDLLLKKKRRVIRRFLSGGVPMQVEDFRRVLANSLALRWITPTQAYSIHQNLLELEAASTWLRRVIRKARPVDEGTAEDEMDRELKASGDAFLTDSAHQVQQIMRNESVRLLQNCSTEPAKLC